MLGFLLLSTAISAVAQPKSSLFTSDSLLMFIPFNGPVSLYLVGAMFGLFQGGIVPSYAIITTDANKVMEPVHDRMPVILSPKFEETWLDPERSNEELESLLIPYKGKDLKAYEVDRAVNSTKNNDPSLVGPVKSSNLT